MACLVQIWKNLLHYNEAIGMARLAVDLAVECLELNHYTTIYCKMALAIILANSGHDGEAARILRDILEIYKTTKEPNHSERVRTKLNAASLLSNLAQFPEARKFSGKRI